MGQLVKNHLARLIVLTAATYQVAAAVHCMIWPKMFWSFLTKDFNFFVEPVPYLQVLNVVLGVSCIAYEWPIQYLSTFSIHASFKARFLLLLLCALAASMMYQGMDSAGYHIIGAGFYLWAFFDGEVILPIPWAFPKVFNIV